MQLIQIIVIRALRDSGWRKTLTPLEMASVPVRAEPPDAKDRISTKAQAPKRTPAPGCPTVIAPDWWMEWAWSWPSTARVAPTTISTAMLTMKKYVGMAKTR